MKLLIKVKVVGILLVFLSTSALAVTSQDVSDLATKRYCDAKAAGQPISEQAAAQQAATDLSANEGMQFMINTACDGRTFAEYSGAPEGGALSFNVVTAAIGGAAAVVAALNNKSTSP